jgi:glycosyltransferase involved in cell wall biosynthesis
MIRVGFLLNFPVEYKGGINYFKNLFTAIQACGDNDIEIVLFVKSDIEEEYSKLFSNITIVKTDVLKRNSISWFIDKVMGKITGLHIFTEILLHFNKINIVSHSNFVSINKKVKSINWVPDFQYIHYPELWSEEQLKATQKLHSFLIHKSDKIVVSSKDAFCDIENNYPSCINKVDVLNFVSQPIFKLKELDLSTLNSSISSYVGNAPYFYLPNQFWKHKNHIVVFKACKTLLDKGYYFQLITTGFMKDYRNNDHMNMLRNYIKDNSLENNIQFLGLVPYEHVLALNLFSIAVINPSFFEGWSSTVEEARSLGSYIILSKINVHKEQNPPKAYYFDPKNEISLADEMQVLLDLDDSPERDFEQLQENLLLRTQIYGNNYISILRSLLK